MRKAALMIAAFGAILGSSPTQTMATENAPQVQSRKQFNGPLSINSPLPYTNHVRRDIGSANQSNPKKRKRGSFLGPGTRKKHTNGIHRSRQLKRKHARNKK